jgi:hypothetical protein
MKKLSATMLVLVGVLAGCGVNTAARHEQDKVNREQILRSVLETMKAEATQLDDFQTVIASNSLLRAKCEAAGYNLRDFDPWQDEQIANTRRLWYLDRHPELDSDVRKCISEGTIQRGLTTEQVVASWGWPYPIRRTVGAWGAHEQWVYGRQYLYFENRILTSWQD